jgi:hypothetical protein
MPHTILSSLIQRDDAIDDEFIPESVSVTVFSESDSDSHSLRGDKNDLDEPHQLKTRGKREAVSPRTTRRTKARINDGFPPVERPLNTGPCMLRLAPSKGTILVDKGLGALPSLSVEEQVAPGYLTFANSSVTPLNELPIINNRNF